MGIAADVLEYGYAFLPAYQPEKRSDEIADSLGMLLKLGMGDAVHRLVPTAQERATPNTYSGIYGLGTFPFHTDFAHWRHPPRYFMLRCIVGFSEVPTLLVDGIEVVQRAGPTLLGRSLVRPRRPVQGGVPLLRLYQNNDGSSLLRWDEKFMQSASKVGKKGVAAIRQSINNSNVISICLTTPSDILVIDNWRMLHSRAAVPSSANSRVLERAYFRRLH